MTQDEEAHARKVEIFRRLQAGERASEIARSLGVSPQYVSWIGKQIQKLGDRILQPTRRGSPKHQPLTQAQTESLRARILMPRPPGDTSHGGRWTSAEIKTWFKETHGRSLAVYELRKFCFAQQVRIAVPADEANPETADPEENNTEAGDTDADPGFPTRRRGRPPGRKPKEPEVVRMTEEMLEAIRRSNEETLARMARARESAATQSTGPVRLGPKIGRNDPCPLDPTKKFKRCCGASGDTRCTKVPAKPEGNEPERHG